MPTRVASNSVLRGLIVLLLVWLIYQVSWGSDRSDHDKACGQARLRCSKTQDAVLLDGSPEVLGECKRAYEDYAKLQCEE